MMAEEMMSEEEEEYFTEIIPEESDELASK